MNHSLLSRSVTGTKYKSLAWVLPMILTMGLDVPRGFKQKRTWQLRLKQFIVTKNICYLSIKLYQPGAITS